MIENVPGDVLEHEAVIAPAISRLGSEENPPPTVRLDDDVVNILRCPNCGGELRGQNESFSCESCEARYPIKEGVPVLVASHKSLFDVDSFMKSEPTFFRPIGKIRRIVSESLPDITLNVAAAHVYRNMLDRILETAEAPKVLVIGGGIVGGGMDCLINDTRIKLIETDVAIAPRTNLICDGHDLPFADSSVDAVIVQAVLEHVIDPQRCVAEIHRVLRPNGLVYSDTPFMQQVHAREYDFTRFTYLGHRRLFRMFDEIDSGISCGPGTALAWSLRYFMLSFFANEKLRSVASLAARLMFFPLKYLDRFLVKNAAAKDAASAFYFFGRRSTTALDDRALVDSYEGGF